MRYLLTILAVLIVSCNAVNTPEVFQGPKPVVVNTTPTPDVTKPLLVDSEQVSAWFQKHNLSTPELNDEYYVVITPEQLLQLVDVTNSLRKQYNLQWTEELTDCDNFARLFQAVAPFILRSSIVVDADLLLFVTIVKQDTDWAGVSGGGYHAIVGIMTTEGPYMIEPQTGQYDKLEDYPNTIIAIRDQ